MRHLSRFAAVALTATLIVAAAEPVLAEANGDVEKAAEVKGDAEKAAEAWLALVDEGKYGDSWDQAAGFFRTAISKDSWEPLVQRVRTPLGKVKSRTLKSAAYTTSLPGAPDGQYVVIQYVTDFENKSGAIETVTPALDKDQTWRVSGYFVR